MGRGRWLGRWRRTGAQLSCHTSSRHCQFIRPRPRGTSGAVGVLTSGIGPTVLVRADMDRSPIQENSGVTYASTDVVKDSAMPPGRS